MTTPEYHRPRVLTTQTLIEPQPLTVANRYFPKGSLAIDSYDNGFQAARFNNDFTIPIDFRLGCSELHWLSQRFSTNSRSTQQHGIDVDKSWWLTYWHYNSRMHTERSVFTKERQHPEAKHQIHYTYGITDQGNHHLELDYVWGQPWTVEQTRIKVKWEDDNPDTSKLAIIQQTPSKGQFEIHYEGGQLIETKFVHAALLHLNNPVRITASQASKDLPDTPDIFAIHKELSLYAEPRGGIIVPSAHLGDIPTVQQTIEGYLGQNLETIQRLNLPNTLTRLKQNIDNPQPQHPVQMLQFIPAY